MHGFRVMAVLLLPVLMLGSLTGCSDKLKAERDSLRNEAMQLRQSNDTLAAALDACEAERTEVASAISRHRMENEDLRNQLAMMQTQPAMPAATMSTPDNPFDEIPGVTGEMGAGEITAVVEGDVLFDSGKVALKSSSKRSLDQIARILNTEYGGHTIRIAGHTDSDPIKKSSWKTNDRLSCERAMAVKTYLLSKGVGDDRMHVAGFGSTEPRETKAKSRRVEIVVILNEA